MTGTEQPLSGGVDMDVASLISTPTRLRATAAALAMVVNGQQPSLSEVARLSGVTRQALNKDHKLVARYVAELRANWQPEQSRKVGDTEAEDLKKALKKEQRLRKRAEEQRDQAPHHLQLAVATLEAERDRAQRSVVALPTSRR